jgi:hypothetical protein
MEKGSPVRRLIIAIVMVATSGGILLGTAKPAGSDTIVARNHSFFTGDVNTCNGEFFVPSGEPLTVQVAYDDGTANQ